MKNLILPLLLSVLAFPVFAQQPTDTINIQVKDITLDLLKSPTNPAFLLMNTSPAEIVEPGSAPEFYTSIQNASDNFSALPNNFGFSVTPFWWTKNAKELNFEKDFDTVNVFTFFRTTSISGGIVKGFADAEDLCRYGIGFQTTLLRGKVDPEKKKEYLSKLREIHEAVYKNLNAYFNDDAGYVFLEMERRNTISEIQKLDELFKAGGIGQAEATNQKIIVINKLRGLQNELDSLKSALNEAFDYEHKSIGSTDDLDKTFGEMNERTGLKWDIGGGLSINSDNNKIDSTRLYRAGFWSNIGGNVFTSRDKSSNLATYFLVRYLFYNEIYYQKDETVGLLENMNTLDFGMKLQYEIADKFSFGVEAINRMGISNSIYESTYKINGLIQYQFGNNKLVYASFGNNFNDNSDNGPQDLVVTFGVNIGFGGNFDLSTFYLR